MPPAGFEPTIPASKRPQTQALDRAATGVGHNLRLDLLQTKHLTNSDQWKEGHALTETHIFDRISDRTCMLSTRPSSPLLRDSTHTVQSTAFSSVKDIIFLAYADDVNILRRSIHTLMENAEALVAATREIGLEVLIKLST